MIRVKEHLLVGYKGDINSVSDPKHVHPNIDTDVVVKEETELNSL